MNRNTTLSEQDKILVQMLKLRKTELFPVQLTGEQLAYLHELLDRTIDEHDALTDPEDRENTEEEVQIYLVLSELISARMAEVDEILFTKAAETI